jgi:hypothetical protein
MSGLGSVGAFMLPTILLFLVLLSRFSSQGTALQNYIIVYLLLLNLHRLIGFSLPCQLQESI